MEGNNQTRQQEESTAITNRQHKTLTQIHSLHRQWMPRGNVQSRTLES